MTRAFRELRTKIPGITAFEDGDRVLALMTIEGRGKGSGVPVVIRSADLFTIRDGKIVSLVGYPDRAEALADMGLSE